MPDQPARSVVDLLTDLDNASRQLARVELRQQTLLERTERGMTGEIAAKMLRDGEHDTIAARLRYRSALHAVLERALFARIATEESPRA